MARKKKPVSSIFWVLGLGVWLAVGWACTGDGVPGDPVVPADESGAVIDLSAVQSMENQWMSSAYFDRAMGTKGARFQAVSFSQLVARNEGEADAVLLNCFDDYQGIVSVADIRKYDLQLATRLELPAKFKKPDWLNPLIIIVPDGSAAPFQERFMTANIRELRLVTARLLRPDRPHRQRGGGIAVVQGQLPVLPFPDARRRQQGGELVAGLRCFDLWRSFAVHPGFFRIP